MSKDLLYVYNPQRRCISYCRYCRNWHHYFVLTVADIPADFDDESNPFQSRTKGDASGKIRGFGIPAHIPRLNSLNFVVELRRCEIASIEVTIKG
jgi:hypothetical protein